MNVKLNALTKRIQRNLDQIDTTWQQIGADLLAAFESLGDDRKFGTWVQDEFDRKQLSASTARDKMKAARALRDSKGHSEFRSNRKQAVLDALPVKALRVLDQIPDGKLRAKVLTDAMETVKELPINRRVDPKDLPSMKGYARAVAESAKRVKANHILEQGRVKDGCFWICEAADELPASRMARMILKTEWKHVDQEQFYAALDYLEAVHNGVTRNGKAQVA